MDNTTFSEEIDKSKALLLKSGILLLKYLY